MLDAKGVILFQSKLIRFCKIKINSKLILRLFLLNGT